MRRSTDRRNRVLLTLVGLLLTGLGAYGLLRGAGQVGGAGRDPVVSRWLRAESREQQVLLLGLLAAAAVLLIWLGLAWLLAQLPRDRAVSHVALEPTARTTRIDLGAKALSTALADDVHRLDGVTDASARVVREHPLAIELDVSLEEGTDLTAVNRAIAERPRRHLLEALEQAEVDLRVRFHLARPAARRVA